MMKISKYHGCGNNFVITRESEIREYLGKEGDMADYRDLAVKVCSINTGVGADGFIVVREAPELEMIFFNCDGSRAPMCGNGIRCFAQYCADKGIKKENTYPVKTLAGDMIVKVTSEDPFRVEINMGSPVLAPEAIAVKDDGDDYLDRTIELQDGTACTVSSLFMGTVHTVVFVDDTEAENLEAMGREICSHPVYTEKTNVNFVKVIDEKTLKVKTYERGVGMTLACGTGACASVVVSGMKGLCKDQVEVILELGSLRISLGDDHNVYMEGPSVRIMDGEFC